MGTNRRIYERRLEDVKAMVEGWKQDYGADDLACARLLMAMAKTTYWGEEPLE